MNGVAFCDESFYFFFFFNIPMNVQENNSIVYLHKCFSLSDTYLRKILTFSLMRHYIIVKYINYFINVSCILFSANLLILFFIGKILMAKYNNVRERKKWEKLVCTDACRILGIDFT